jgi:hypothetical protein
MKDKLVTIARFDSPFDAELARTSLESNDIEAVVLGGDLVANMFTIDAIKVELQVFQEDVSRAMEVLESATVSEEQTDPE